MTTYNLVSKNQKGDNIIWKLEKEHVMWNVAVTVIIACLMKIEIGHVIMLNPMLMGVKLCMMIHVTALRIMKHEDYEIH